MAAQKAPQPDTSKRPSSMPRQGEKEKAPSGASEARASAHNSGTRKAVINRIERMMSTGPIFVTGSGGGARGFRYLVDGADRSLFSPHVNRVCRYGRHGE